MVRRILLALLALVMLLTAIFTWGSIGSACMVFCLIMMGASLLYQRFITNRDEDLWQEE